VPPPPPPPPPVYSLLGSGGCRQRGCSHGDAGVTFLRSPADSAASQQACFDYCDASADCLAIEWETPEGGAGPKCEIWLEMPAFAETKAHHSCHVKHRALQTSPPSAPADASDTCGQQASIDLALIVVVAAPVLLVLILAACALRRRALQHRPKKPASELQLHGSES